MKIGVIGGNGVAATNRLCDMIERKVTRGGAFRDAHHPEMIVWQATSVPSRSMFLEGRGPDWRPDYIRIAKDLRALGCDIGCMCCNTAHYAIDDIEAESGLKFINLLKEVACCARATGHKRFEMLCSDGARKFDLYGAVFREFAPELKILYPSEDRQALVTKVICGVKCINRFSPEDSVESPKAILSSLVDSAVAPVILGCTDLRIAYGNEDSLGRNIAVDSLETLANSIVELSKRSFE